MSSKGVAEMSELTRPTEANLAEELAQIPYEPLLPIEKKLIAWSLILGIVLLALLAWVSATFFEAS